jgi:hypothetical protein
MVALMRLALAGDISLKDVLCMAFYNAWSLTA